jgi:GNAT superfamily N-acetyltransferase
MTDLRLAVAADRAAIEAIVEAAYAPYVERIGRRPAPMDEDYAALIAAGRVQVAEVEGQVRGLLVLIPEAEAMLLDNIAVATQARGTGLGRFLLQSAEAQAKAAGYAVIRLYTNAAMTENIALYGRIGYLETRRGGESGFRRVYMEKRLD